MAYHGFVEQDGKYAILMDERDVKAIVNILGAHSGVPNSGEYSVLDGMWEQLKEFRDRSAKMCARGTGESITNWYYKEK